MSNLIINAKNSIDAINQLVNSADMQGRNLSMAHIRAVCADDFDVKLALETAESRGVKVTGAPRKQGFQSPTDVHPWKMRSEHGKGCIENIIFMGILIVAVVAVIGLIDGVALTSLADSVEKILAATGG